MLRCRSTVAGLGARERVKGERTERARPEGIATLDTRGLGLTLTSQGRAFRARSLSGKQGQAKPKRPGTWLEPGGKTRAG